MKIGFTPNDEQIDEMIDRNEHNNVSTAAYIDALTKIIEGVHGKWPKAHVIVMVSFLSTRLSPLVNS